MKPAGGLVSSVDRCWVKLRAKWKEARHDWSETAIHDLRVSSRRMMAALELLHALSGKKEIERLRRNVRSLLKAVGPLRDVQVEAERVSKLRPAGPLHEFERDLERRERRHIRSVRGTLKRSRRRKLAHRLKRVRRYGVRLQQTLGRESIIENVNESIHAKWNEFFRARRALRVSDELSAHRLRLAVKKLRYTIEAAQPLVRSSSRLELRQLENLQEALGEMRDIRLLIRKIEAWAAKHEREKETAAAVAALREQWKHLDAKIPRLAESFVNPSAGVKRPATEDTIAVPGYAPATMSAPPAGAS